MGTEFDFFGERANTAYYEDNASDADSEARKNRRILYNLMIDTGFTNLPSEWWHFDYGDKLWAYYTGNEGLYTGIFEEERA